jgi:hypothetical protein
MAIDDINQRLHAGLSNIEPVVTSSAETAANAKDSLKHVMKRVMVEAPISKGVAKHPEEIGKATGGAIVEAARILALQPGLEKASLGNCLLSFAYSEGGAIRTSVTQAAAQLFNSGAAQAISDAADELKSESQGKGGNL